jgi:hypothetical protein
MPDRHQCIHHILKSSIFAGQLSLWDRLTIGARPPDARPDRELSDTLEGHAWSSFGYQIVAYQAVPMSGLSNTTYGSQCMYSSSTD